MLERDVEKIIWGSRYPRQDATTAWDAVDQLRKANVSDDYIARMMGGNAPKQFGINLAQKVGA